MRERLAAGGVDHDVDLLDVALVFALLGGAELKVQAGMDHAQWHRHLWNAEGRCLGRRMVVVFAPAIFGFPLDTDPTIS